MSFSAIKINTTGHDIEFERLSVDSDNIVDWVEANYTNTPGYSHTVERVISPKDEGVKTYIEQIVITSGSEVDNIDKFAWGNHVFATYHHGTDPTAFEVIGEINHVMEIIEGPGWVHH